MSDVAKAEPEAASNDATTNPPIHFREIPEERQPVNQPQGRQILEQTSPTKAWTLFVVRVDSRRRCCCRVSGLGCVGKPRLKVSMWFRGVPYFIGNRCSSLLR